MTDKEQPDPATVRYLEQRRETTERRGETKNLEHIENLLGEVTGDWSYKGMRLR